MKISYCEQLSMEWFKLCAGSIGGTRFGAVISGKKNRLIYELLDEQLNGYVEPDEYVSDDMLFGTEQEPIARQLYSEQSGIDFKQVGMILSEQSAIHHASPDGLSDDGIVLEIKCTQNGYIHLQRFFEGVESGHMAQLQNYFAVSDEVKEVHWISWCPSRTERPLISFVFTRDSLIKDGKTMCTIQDQVIEGRKQIALIEAQLKDMRNQFEF
jgi:predicted phage-related endonuclease